MAGDWLKMEANTPEKAEVLAITAMLGWEDADLTVGKLFRLWRWFDQHTVNGNAASVTPALLDRIVGVTGFCAAVQKVGWLEVTDAGVSLPKFDRHNGNTAKNRALTAKRVAKHKVGGSGNAEGNGGGNAESVSGALPREEKEKEKKETVSGQMVGGADAPPAATEPTPPAPAPANPRGTRLPTDWQLPKAWGEWALAEYPHWTADIVRIEAAKFKDHWTAKTGKGSTSLDWVATWRNWCRSDIAQRAHAPRPAPRPAPRQPMAPMDTAARNAEAKALLGLMSPTNPQDQTTEVLDA